MKNFYIGTFFGIFQVLFVPFLIINISFWLTGNDNYFGFYQAYEFANKLSFFVPLDTLRGCINSLSTSLDKVVNITTRNVDFFQWLVYLGGFFVNLIIVALTFIGILITALAGLLKIVTDFLMLQGIPQFKAPVDWSSIEEDLEPYMYNCLIHSE